MSKPARPSIFGAMSAPVVAQPVVDSTVATAIAKPSKGEGELFKTSIYLPPAVKDKLEEIAFHEGRKKVHDLFIEGIDAVLQKRGYPTTAEMREASKAS